MYFLDFFKLFSSFRDREKMNEREMANNVRVGKITVYLSSMRICDFQPDFQTTNPQQSPHVVSPSWRGRAVSTFSCIVYLKLVLADVSSCSTRTSPSPAEHLAHFDESIDAIVADRERFLRLEHRANLPRRKQALPPRGNPARTLRK